MPHDFEHPPAVTALRDMAADIDDLSRDHTEEIEAHRLTRERAEKAEAKLANALVRSLELIDERDTLRVRLAVAADRAERAERVLADEREWYAAAKRGLDEANARLAELVREVMEWVSCPANESVIAPWKALVTLLKKYDGGESPPPTLTEIYAAQERAAEAARACCGEFETSSGERVDESDGGEHG
jgi:hypothetical protein